MPCEQDLFLGFDLSTQQLKIIVTDASLNHLNTYTVEFDAVYAEKYEIRKGVRSNESTGEIVSPVLMWLDAMDHVFTEMKRDNFPFERVKGISGSGQQHGSIYWSKQAHGLLKNLDAGRSLSEQLDDALALKTSPNWQDHSTGKEIEIFESVTGGPDKLAEITGSRAHYRFTGLQIRKLATRNNDSHNTYEKTDRISLVSSFVASVLLGHVTNIEEADACGMNVYDIVKSSYDDELLALAAGVHSKVDNATPEETKKGVAALKLKLGEILPVSYKNAGTISSYFVDKYGFSPETKIYSFTGDNLATIISLPLFKEDCLVSLGTSTTVLIITKNYNASSQYHLFKHPTMPGYYMGMICYCNGSLSREKVRNELNEKLGEKGDDPWTNFNSLLDNSSSFNNKLGVYFSLGEIVPNASAQVKRCQLNDEGKLVNVEKWDVENDVSSIVESQTLSCRLRSGPMLTNSADAEEDVAAAKKEDPHLTKTYEALVEKFGDLYTDGKKQTYQSLTARPHKVYYVGGGSNNQSIISKMGSILGAKDGNFKVEISNACALGGSYKASWSYRSEQEDGAWIDYDKYIESKFDFKNIDKFEVNDHWEDYFTGLGMLATMEADLKHD